MKADDIGKGPRNALVPLFPSLSKRVGVHVPHAGLSVPENADKDAVGGVR